MTENKDNKSIQLLLIGGLITLIVNIIVSIYQEHKKVEMEKIQFESTLIISAIDKSNIESSKKNIKFLIESELISKKNQKILSLLTDSTFSIKIPEKDTIFIEPQNSIEIGSTFIKSIYSAQIIDENNNPLEGVEIITNSYPSINGSYYAKTLSDSNGLFKIPIPEGRNYTLSIQKNSFIGSKTLYKNSKYLIHPKQITLYKK